MLVILQILHYYLVDDSVEVREVHEPNDGRDPFPVLLRRQKLPKDRDAVKGQGHSLTHPPTDFDLSI